MAETPRSRCKGLQRDSVVAIRAGTIKDRAFHTMAARHNEKELDYDIDFFKVA